MELFFWGPEIDAGAWRYAAHTGQLPTRLASDWKESRSPADLTDEEWGRHILAMVEASKIPAVQGGLTADTLTAIGDPA